jgi:hypothetical protein
MSGAGGYNAKVVAPDDYMIQTESDGFQKPFFFGAAQVPSTLMLKRGTFSGSGMTLKTGAPSMPKAQIVLPLR